MTWRVVVPERDRTLEFDHEEDAREKRRELEGLDLETTIEPPEYADGGELEVVESPLTAQDPQEALIERDWMLTTITHADGSKSEDLNKRGAQVIAEALGVYPDSELLASDLTGDPAYAVVRAWVIDPETGREYSAHGEARSTEQNVGDHEVIRQAETRAKKRCIKWVSASGAKALLQAGEEVPDQ